jgi:hypothetical protein
MDSLIVEQVNNHLLKLQEYLTPLDNTHKLSSVVNDFIGNTNSLLGLFNNDLQIKLSLKANIALLDQAFLNYWQTTDCYKQLLFVSSLPLSHNDEES